MIAYTRAQLVRLLKIDFVRFCIVGGLGFVINFVLLIGFHRLIGLDVFVSQLLAAEVALFCNFMLHHHWTYKHRAVSKSFSVLLVQFHATSWPAIIGSALMVTAGENIFHLSSLLALGLSSAVALAWNFAWSKFVVWRDITPKRVEEIVE